MIEGTFQKAYPLALRAARVRSAAAVTLGVFQAAEREDLEQEAVVALWRALPVYDASRASLRTFVERVVAARFSSLLRSRLRRQPTEPVSEHHVSTLDGIPAVEFRADFELVLSSMHKRDRQVAQLLTEHGPTEASRQLGVSRSAVYERIGRLRTAFRAAGYEPAGGAR